MAVSKTRNPKVRQRSGVLCLSEIIFIAVWYKKSQLHHFKAFYGMIKRFYSKLFKGLPSYQRIVYLINQHQLALQALHISLASNAQTTCAWVDSTTLPVCKNQRIQRHKSLKQIATRGKSSMDVSCMCWWMLRENLFTPNSQMAIHQISRFCQS